MQQMAQNTQNTAHLKSQPQQSSTHAGPQNNEFDVNKLFKELGGIYGYLWKSMHQTVEDWCAAKNWWEKKLKHFSADEIDFAIEKCMTLKNADGRYRLPILQEFIDFAEQQRKRKLENEAQDRRNKIIKLPAPKVSDEQIAAGKSAWKAFIEKYRTKNNAA